MTIEHIMEKPYLTREQLIDGLQTGIYVVQNSNSIELEDLLDLEKLGLVECTVVVRNNRTALAFRWKGKGVDDGLGQG